VFTQKDLTSTPNISSSEHPISSKANITFTSQGIHQLLFNLDTNKADQIPSFVLKHYAKEISAILEVIFTNHSPLVNCHLHDI